MKKCDICKNRKGFANLTCKTCIYEPAFRMAKQIYEEQVEPEDQPFKANLLYEAIFDGKRHFLLVSGIQVCAAFFREDDRLQQISSHESIKQIAEKVCLKSPAYEDSRLTDVEQASSKAKK